MSTPPPLPPRDTRPYREPPPLPEEKWRPGRGGGGARGTAIAVGIVALLAVAGLGAYYAAEALAQADEPSAEATAPVVNPLSEALAAIDGRNDRYLPGEAYVKKVFVQNARIIRYQLIYADLVEDGRPVFATYAKRRAPTIALVRGDSLVAPVLRRASSIYVDVYDQNDEHLFSYDLTPADIWPAADAAPTPAE